MSEDEWAELLTGMQYQVTRGHGTERAWTGLHNDTKDKGCVFNTFIDSDVLVILDEIQ